jgi:hypothetical protein
MFIPYSLCPVLFACFSVTFIKFPYMLVEEIDPTGAAASYIDGLKLE